MRPICGRSWSWTRSRWRTASADRSRGLIAHNDRGSQYTSIKYTGRLYELGIAPSVGSRGDALENATAEAWVATFKTELVDGRRFPSFEHAEQGTLAWIGFYNDERLHEELGDIAPAEYERNHEKEANNRRPFGPVEAGQPALAEGRAGRPRE